MIYNSLYFSIYSIYLNLYFVDFLTIVSFCAQNHYMIVNNAYKWFKMCVLSVLYKVKYRHHL